MFSERFNSNEGSFIFFLLNQI